MQTAVQLIQAVRPLVSRPAAGARRPAHPLICIAAASSDGISWLSEQVADVEAQAAADAAAAAAAASDDSKAHSVGLGLHIRGRSAFQEGLTDEDDPARFYYHRLLSQAARSATPGNAESAVEEMTQAGFVPGPRAYHALVLSYVKAQDAGGALGAIRRCWDAGITPLPETYAAVVAAHVAVGDMETAEAVCASNRRAGVDYIKSWQQLVAALARAGDLEKAYEMLSQGDAEGMQRNEAMCEALIVQLCAQGARDAALAELQAMQEHGLKPSLPHFEPLISVSAELGDVDAAWQLLESMVQIQSGFPPGTWGLCNKVYEAQLAASQSGEEIATYTQRMKGLLLRANVQWGARFYATQLQAALRLRDVQFAMEVFRALRIRSAAPLQRLSDEVLADLMLQLSHACLPAELYEVLSAMSREQRRIPHAALQSDEGGCTALGAWVQQRLDQALTWQHKPGIGSEVQDPEAVQQAASSVGRGEGGTPGSADGGGAVITVDGVCVDPVLLCVVDQAGAPLAVSRMGVRELRAELVARRAPVSGNKKELSKRLQKLRQMDGMRAGSLRQRLRAEFKTGGSSSSSNTRKVSVIVTDLSWGDGALVEEVRYKDEKEVAEVAEEEGEETGEAADWDLEEEEVVGGSQRGSGRDEDEVLEDEEEGVVAATDAAGLESTFVLSLSPPFTSRQAGPHEAATMLLAAVVDLHSQPSLADLQAVAGLVRADDDMPAAVLLAAAIDRMPEIEAAEGAATLRAELSALGAAHGVDLDAAIESLELLKRSEPVVDGIDAEMAEMLQALGSGA